MKKLLLGILGVVAAVVYIVFGAIFELAMEKK